MIAAQSREPSEMPLPLVALTSDGGHGGVGRSLGQQLLACGIGFHMNRASFLFWAMSNGPCPMWNIHIKKRIATFI